MSTMSPKTDKDSLVAMANADLQLGGHMAKSDPIVATYVHVHNTCTGFTDNVPISTHNNTNTVDVTLPPILHVPACHQNQTSVTIAPLPVSDSFRKVNDLKIKDSPQQRIAFFMALSGAVMLIISTILPHFFYRYSGVFVWCGCDDGTLEFRCHLAQWMWATWEFRPIHVLYWVVAVLMFSAFIGAVVFTMRVGRLHRNAALLLHNDPTIQHWEYAIAVVPTVLAVMATAIGVVCVHGWGTLVRNTSVFVAVSALSLITVAGHWQRLAIDQHRKALGLHPLQPQPADKKNRAHVAAVDA